MAGHIIIERLECEGYCGITAEERERPQKLAVDVELVLPLDRAAETDDLVHTVDYAAVAAGIATLVSQYRCHLLEHLAERIVAMLFANFPVGSVKIWLRKLAAPLSTITRSVGVRVERTRHRDCWNLAEPPPAPFLVQQRDRLPSGTALDVAAGSGRNALHLLQQGFAVEAIDRDEAALGTLRSLAQARGWSSLTTKSIDLEQPSQPPDFGHERYDVIVVFFYLFRPLFAPLIQALKTGGLMVYETFLIDNHLRHHHPRRSEFCLAHNELLRLTSPLRVLHYDEGEHEIGSGPHAAFTARLVAQKPLDMAAP